MVKMTLNKTTADFGIEGYNIPYSSHPYKPKSIATRKSKPGSFFVTHVESKKWVPGHKYDTVADWKKILPGQGKFSK